ncbi:uncharacterized protein [Malus domestica]|uniref:uncharacterized protein n=1 Tax=Malus domestica TaxID=3750 RepID=UPI0039764393
MTSKKYTIPSSNKFDLPISHVPRVPFPQRLTSSKKNSNYKEILELFKQVQISIPLLDAIDQVPAYVKFVKELCTPKRKSNVHKKVFLARRFNSVITRKFSQKYKDPGCPTVTCTIGDHTFEKALLDLGASVNLLPYSVFLQLGLGDLKPTSITLQLADRSIKTPRGIVEDVLVQVGKFTFDADFVILDTVSV